MITSIGAGFLSSRDINRNVIEIASHLFSPKNRICYRILKLNENNLRLFRFFNNLSTVLYLVTRCDCFVIIMFLGKETFEFGYDLLRHCAFCNST